VGFDKYLSCQIVSSNFLKYAAIPTKLSCPEHHPHCHFSPNPFRKRISQLYQLSVHDNKKLDIAFNQYEPKD
jgi:hypothetical protein